MCIWILLCIILFCQSFEHHIADLNWCLGNAYRLKDDFKKPPEYFKRALKLYKSQNDILKQVKVYIELGKAYRWQRII